MNREYVGVRVSVRVWGWVVGGGECVFMTLTPSLCSRRSSGPTWRPSPSRSTLSYRTSRACLWCWARHCGSGLNCSPSTRNCVHSVFHQSHSVYPFTTGMIYCCKTCIVLCVITRLFIYCIIMIICLPR